MASASVMSGLASIRFRNYSILISQTFHVLMLKTETDTMKKVSVITILSKLISLDGDRFCQIPGLVYI